MPSAAPAWKTWSKVAIRVAWSRGSPQESLTMLARWLSTMSASAASRSESLQLAART